MPKLLLTLIALLAAFAAATVHGAPGPFYYHWAGRNTVYLWLNGSDPRPVVATQKKNQSWVLDPPAVKTNAEWAAVVRDYAQNVPQGKDPWEVFLNRLHAEQPNDDVAKVKPLDLQVYLRVRSPERVALTLIGGGTPPAPGTTVEFNKRDGAWRAVNPEALTRTAAERAADIRAVLGTQERPPADAAKLEALWGAWIDQFGKAEQNTTKLLPVEVRAVWQERLSEAEWLRRTSLGMALTQPTPTQPQPAPTTSPVATATMTAPFYKEWWFLFITTFAVAGVLVGLTFILRPKWLFDEQTQQRRPRKESKEAKRERLRRSRERGVAVFDRDGDGTPDESPLDGAYEEHAHAVVESFKASLERLRQQVETNKNRLSKTLGINDMRPDEAREVIEAGLAARDCYSSLLKVQQAYAGMSHGLYPQSRNKRQWLSALPETINTVTEELSAKTEEANRLSDDVKRINELAERRERELKAAELELTTLQQQKTALESRLDEATRRNEDSQVILDAIAQATVVAKNLQQGLRYYLDKANDATTTGVIAALINYSLTKLCQGYVDGDDELVNAMLANLYNIASNLQNVNGFKIALHEMEKHYTDIRSLGGRLVTTDKKDFDDRMFQMLLKHLREQGRVDLSPFYFAGDQDKKVHVAS